MLVSLAVRVLVRRSPGQWGHPLHLHHHWNHIAQLLRWTFFSLYRIRRHVYGFFINYPGAPPNKDDVKMSYGYVAAGPKHWTLCTSLVQLGCAFSQNFNFAISQIASHAAHAMVQLSQWRLLRCRNSACDRRYISGRTLQSAEIEASGGSWGTSVDGRGRTSVDGRGGACPIFALLQATVPHWSWRRQWKCFEYPFRRLSLHGSRNPGLHSHHMCSALGPGRRCVCVCGWGEIGRSKNTGTGGLPGIPQDLGTHTEINPQRLNSEIHRRWDPSIIWPAQSANLPTWDPAGSQPPW